MAKLQINIKDEDVLESLNPDIDKAKSVQDDLAGQREEYYKRYRGAPYGNERVGWSQSVAPIIYNNLQWSLPSLMEIFHAEYFTLQSDNEDRANNFQKLIYYQMYRKQDGFRKAHDFLYDAFLYHYAIFKCSYKEDFDIESEVHDRLTADEMMALAQQPNVTITKYDEVQGEEVDGYGVKNVTVAYEKVKVAKKKVLYAGPHLEVVPPWEWYYSPDCKIGDWGSIDGRLVYHEVTRTMNDIRKKERAGIYRKGSYEKVLANFDEANQSTAKPDSYEILVGVDDISSQDTQAPETNELSKEVKIRECYYRLDIDGDGLLEPVIVDLCGDVILRLEENPYMRPPFRIGSVSPEPHKVTGIAMPNTLENDQKVMTNLLRLIQDSAAQSCYRNPVTSDQSMFKMLQDRKPFATILGNPEKLGEVKQAPPDQFILKAYDMLLGNLENKTGNTKYNQGTDAASLNKTATGVSAIFNASEKRMRLTAALMGNGPFLGVIRDFMFINQKWPGQDPIKLLGQNIQINPDDLSGDYDIEVDIGTSPSEKQAQGNQIDMFIQFATQAGIQMGIVDETGVRNAIKSKYRVLAINATKWLVDDKKFQALQAQKEQQKAQMQAQQQQQQAQQMAMQAQQAQQPIQQAQQQHQQTMQQKQQVHGQQMQHKQDTHNQQMAQKQQVAQQQPQQRPQ